LASVTGNVGLAVNGDGVVTLRQIGGDIKGEGRIAAAMSSDRYTVHENLCFVANGFEIQNDALLLTVRDVHGFAIPAAGDKVFVTDAGKLAFGTEGNLDRFFQMFFACDTAGFSGFSEIEFEFPFAAEIDPAFADKLGTGICVSGSHGERSFQENYFVAFMVSQK
jgi:hypothetical protein